jgi:cytochrome P450
MAEVVGTAVEASPTGEPVEAYREMTRIVHRVIRRVFFADRIGAGEVDRLGAATTGILAALASRMVLPFVPDSVPLPGDATFRRAARTADEVLVPVIRESRERGDDGTDLVTMLSRARDDAGVGLDEDQLRDDLVALFAAGTESTAVALTWLWVLLDGHRAVAGRLRAEVDEVVGSGPVTRAHLPGLRYTRMVLQEALRLYPPGWLIPRTAAGPDLVGGVPIRPGDTVLISPYLTHRVPGWWDRPAVFDPDRFSPGRAAGRHPFAYLPFGAGPHRCLGSHFFTVEAQLIVAAMVSRYRLRLAGTRSVSARLGASLRPRQRVALVLSP